MSAKQESTYIHMDLESYAALFNKAYDLLPAAMDNDERCEIAENIVALIRQSAPGLVAVAVAQAKAERIIRDALLGRLCAACGHLNLGYGEPDNCAECATPLAGEPVFEEER